MFSPFSVNSRVQKSYCLLPYRHMRPKIERINRKCFSCRNDIEDELHFITKCPLYKNERESLFQTCRDSSIHFDSYTSDYQRFVFILSNEDHTVLRSLSKFISTSFEKRKELRNGCPPF